LKTPLDSQEWIPDSVFPMSTKTKKSRIRELSARYPRVIEWSPEDGVFVGSAPPLVGQCCHGSSE